MAATRRSRATSSALIGAVIGGVLGYYTFKWILDHGFYGMMIPGGLLGLGCGLLAQHPFHMREGDLPRRLAWESLEWRFAPFIADQSWYYLKNIVAESKVAWHDRAGASLHIGWKGRGFRDFRCRAAPSRGQTGSGSPLSRKCSNR